MEFGCKSLVFVGLMVLVGCAPQRPGREGTQRKVSTGKEAGDVVVAVGEDEVHVDEFNARTASLTAFASKGEASRDAEIQAVVQFEVLADEAERKGYGKDPRVVNELKDALAHEFAGTEQTKLVDELGQEAEVKIDEAAAQRALEAGKK